jgi:F-type H+-transporting ATPase subunit b
VLESLGISWQGLIAQIVCFVILLALLIGFGYKPIQKMLDERSKRIKEGLDKAELAKEAAAKAEQEVQRRLDEARREGQTILAQAYEMGERLKAEAREEAKREAEAFIQRARAEIELERDEAIDRLRAEFADLAILAAERVIKEALDKEAHRRLIDEVLEESTTLRK